MATTTASSVEPNPGFGNVLSKWKARDQELAGDGNEDAKSNKSFLSCHASRTSRNQAKEELRRRRSVDKSDRKSLRKNSIREEPSNIYQKPIEESQLPVYYDHETPVFSQTEQEKEKIQRAIENNFIFSSLPTRDLEPMISAFGKCSFHKNEIIIQQGDPGDYFYILDSGSVKFEVSGSTVGEVNTSGASFGELALLYTCPRAASVIATANSKLFRVNQKTFRSILQKQTNESGKEKTDLLKGIEFLKSLASDDLKKLSSAMTPRVFSKDEVLIEKGDEGNSFYVLKEGKVVVKDISVGSTKYEDQILGPGEYFGERALLTSEPRAATVVGLSKTGMAFSIDRDTFEEVLGGMSFLVLKAQDARKLMGIKVFDKASLDPRQVSALAGHFRDREYSAGETILEKGDRCKAALFFVREGEVIISDQSDEKVTAGGYFGDDLLVLDVAAGTKTMIEMPYTMTATQDCVCGVLTLADCQSVFDTKLLKKDEEVTLEKPTAKTPGNLEDLTKHTVLGEGTFSQVWLVSQEVTDTVSDPYALKIQSKRELVLEGQALAIVREKELLTSVNHPCIINLHKTYQDENFVYMLLDFVQGGELRGRIYDEDSEGIPELQSKFYALIIADALAYLHHQRIVLRDLKPSNVLIDSHGYPVVIDFGFAKFVPDKTYTLCGPPAYLAPEVIMTRGHDCSADHWSLGILIHEMITGENPFYVEGMDQMSLFESIVEGDFEPSDRISASASILVSRLLSKDPTRRLGSLARGEHGILKHTWFHGMDLDALLRKEVKAPWIPPVNGALDSSCFEDWSDVQDMATFNYPALTAKSAAIFDGF